MDKEKVINGLKELSGFLFKEYGKAQAEEASIYYDRFLAVDNAITLLEDCDTQLQYRDDHIAMYQAEIKRLEAILKEQKAVKPEPIMGTSISDCGKCRHAVAPGMNYCPVCGCRIDWN